MGEHRVKAPSRPTLTERRAEDLRMDIALAARDIFLADGTTAATVERICEAVGIAPRTFHRHFPVKEDVVMPLFRQFGNLSIQVLQQAPAGGDVVDVLIEAFGTELTKRGEVEIGRRFMALVLADPQYRLRWLDWGQDLTEPISDFLGERFDLGADPFERTLPAQLVIQVCRHAYAFWVDSGDFARLESALRRGFDMTLRCLPRRADTPKAGADGN
jgi:AcrR family transcriptional regulator